MTLKRKASLMPPVAEKRPETFVLHGDTRVDEYAWMKDKTDAAVLPYLESENAYADGFMASSKKLQTALYKEMKSRMKEDDMTVPIKDGPYYYYTRTKKGKQYAIHCRTLGTKGKEEIILDENKLAKGEKFFNLGHAEVSPDHNLLAYSVDTAGDEKYALVIKDLRTGKMLNEKIDMVGQIEWANDNRHFFYTTEKHPHPPDKILLHELGGDIQSDKLIYQEADPQWYVSIDKSRDHRFVFFYSANFDATEASFVSADAPQATPQLIEKRAAKVKYFVEHHQGSFYIMTNERAVNFKIIKTSAAAPQKKNWNVWMAERKDRAIFGFSAYETFFVLDIREKGVEEVYISNVKGKGSKIEFPEEGHSIGVWGDEEYESTSIRMTYQSFISPRTVYDYDIPKKKLVVRKKQEVPKWNPKQYLSKRLWVKSGNVKVPVTLAYAKKTKLDGTAPMLLSAYGSYGICSDPVFSITRVSLLERGWIIAEANPRGGGEMGWQWHEDAKLLTKERTYDDVIAVIDSLVKNKYSPREKIALMGGSAGGMMVGAVFNMRPDICGIGIAVVPAADLVTSSLDESLGGTRLHYDETGDPRIKEQYFYLKKTSPYENVKRADYPALLVRASFFDNRTPYWEAAKWVARLRTKKTDQNPLLFKTELNAGHFGKSGRYEWLKERAFDYAFLLKMTGAK